MSQCRFGKDHPAYRTGDTVSDVLGTDVHWGQRLQQVMLSAGLGPVQGSRSHRHLPGREILG